MLFGKLFLGYHRENSDDALKIFIYQNDRNKIMVFKDCSVTLIITDPPLNFPTEFNNLFLTFEGDSALDIPWQLASE